MSGSECSLRTNGICRVLLFDLEGPSGAGPSLRDILQQDTERVRLRHEEDGALNLSETAEHLRKVLVSDSPNLLFLVLPEVALGWALGLLQQMRRLQPCLPIIVVANPPNPKPVEDLIQEGLTDYLVPPLRVRDVLPRLWMWAHPARREDATGRCRAAQMSLEGLCGASPRFIAEIAKIPAFAQVNTDVIIFGETGTGKEVCARAIHRLSARAHRPFTPVDCGGLPVSLLENELFGHAPGAYTSARAAAPGLLAATEGGTLFLDEIHDLPLAGQAKLLRMLQQKEYRPLGSPKSVSIDLRVISASNVDLLAEVRAGRFRQDLFYRLQTLQLTLPPLREREGDIELLARHFLQQYADEYQKPARELSRGALYKLAMHDWPGNVRELQNVIQRAVFASLSPGIQPEDILLPEPAGPVNSYKSAKAQAVSVFEAKYCRDLMRITQSNLSAAARLAGIDRGVLRMLLRKHNLRTNTNNTGGTADQSAGGPEYV